MNNNGIKVMLVILIVICLFQGCGLASMTEDIEDMRNCISQMEGDIQSLSNRIQNFEAEVEQEGILMDWAYGIEKVDWEAGNIHVACQVTLRESGENTRVIIENGNGTYELARSGGNYTGTVVYPIDNNGYETVVYQYSGDVLIESENADYLSAGSLLCKYVLCEFYGMSSYGNGKLTLAGEMEYYINLEENVTVAKLVCVDEEIELKNYEQGRHEINDRLLFLWIQERKNFLRFSISRLRRNRVWYSELIREYI